MCSADFPNRRPWTGRSRGSRPCSWGPKTKTIHAYARRQQTVSEHQQRIGEYLRLRTFDTAAGERLVRFLEDEALRLDRTASLLARARGWLRDEHVLAPADSVLRRAVGAARHKARALLTQRMAERLSAPMRDRLDELVEATGVLDIDVSWVNGNYQRILFHSVRTASADRVREMAAPRRHLALVCFLHQAWRDTLDQAVDMYGKLLDRNRKLVDERLDGMLKAQRHAVDRIVQRLPPARCRAARSRRRRRRVAGPTAVDRPCRRRSCTRTSPTWRTGRGATGRPASSRRLSGTPG